MICYALWFLTLFLIPAIVFSRLTIVYPEMIVLKGLALKPVLKNGNIVSISNNFDEFMKKNTSLKESNIFVKMLRSICNDADKGIRHNPNLYLSNLQATLHAFVLWILLGSHVPLFILLFRSEIRSVMPYNAMPFLSSVEIVKYQICCYFLIYVLEMIVKHKNAQFTRIFYANWYDKILNFDLLTVGMIRGDVERIKKLSNSHDLLEAVDKFATSNSLLSNILSSYANMLSKRLDEFLNIQQKANGINAQTVLLSLDDCIAKFTEIHEKMQDVAKNAENSMDSLTKVSKLNKNTINAINQNADILSDLREQFKNYQSEAYLSELNHLQKATGILEDNVGKAFASIDTAVTQNFSRLEQGYDKFFDMCKTLSEAISDKYEEKTASILTSLFNSLSSELSAVRERMDGFANVIDSTSDATKVICKTVYEFTQYTMSPDFMGRITNYVNFSHTLKDAADKLISYQKLAELGDVTINNQTNFDDKKNNTERL
jgi:hypothetical protein